MSTYERGDIVWVRTKFMFFDGHNLKKSEVHLCVQKAVILGFSEDNRTVSFGSKYLKRVYGLPDENNWFTTDPSNLSFSKNSLAYSKCSLIEFQPSVYFIYPESGARGKIAEMLGFKDQFEAIRFKEYLKNGTSGFIPIHTPIGTLHVPSHLTKSTSMNLVDWREGLPSSYYSMMYELLGQI